MKIILPQELVHAVRATPGAISGFVYDRADLTRRFVVELRLGDETVAVVRADLLDASLAALDGFDRRCGFYFALPDPADRGPALVRLANLDMALGDPVALDRQAAPPNEAGDVGHVQWLGGLHLRGWLRSPPTGDAPEVHASIAGVKVATARARKWINIDDGGQAVAARAFDLHLPASLANGDVYRVDVSDKDGAPLSGSPVAVMAFVDGLRALTTNHPTANSETLRADMFDRLVPQSLPFSMFEAWRERYASRPANVFGLHGLALIGDGDGEATLASLANESACEWLAGLFAGAAGQTAYDAADLVTFLEEEASACETIVFAPAGTLFYPGGFALLAGAVVANPQATIAYADYVAETDDGEQVPVALPEFSYERQLEQGYGALLFAMRREAALAAARAGVGDLFALFLHAIGAAAPRRGVAISAPGFAARLPRIGLADASARLASASRAHLRARAIEAEVEPSAGSKILPAARVKRKAAAASVTAIVLTRDRADLLRACVESTAPALARRKAQLIVVDNGTVDPATIAYLDSLQAKGALVIREPGPFNYARLNNRAAEAANGEILALLNNDVEALDDAWLEEMLSRMAEPDVGAVGAKLLWPSRVVQHGGVTLGLRYAADHAFNDLMDGAPGYADLLCVAREASAVTGACLVTRKRDFDSVAGFDARRFPVNFNDVDYCLKQIAAGRRVIFTPHAGLIHKESASRGADRAPDRAARFAAELRALRDRWGATLLDDPYYSPMLALDGVAYEALAWPPRGRRAMAERAHERVAP